MIEPGNSFLAGCGFLGEVACDGSREVGLFWSKALGWPLVWDEDQETAIQSPAGGTKIAWGGPPVLPAKDRGGLHFDLVTGRRPAAPRSSGWSPSGRPVCRTSPRTGPTAGRCWPTRTATSSASRAPEVCCDPERVKVGSRCRIATMPFVERV